MTKTPGTEPVIAQKTESNAPVAVATPRYPRPERQGGSATPVSYRFPEIRGGICEYCGVIDPNTPSQYQYRLCPHFREIGALSCSYCPEGAIVDEVIKMSVVTVQTHPDNPDKLVVWCNRRKCTDAHNARFNVSAR